MNNMSLVKITLGVAFATVATVATFIVDANEVVFIVDDTKGAALTTEKQDVIEVETSSFQEKAFSKILLEFDTDKNGVLSEAELSKSNNDALKMAFKNLDLNEDGNISLDEFSIF